jgi:hypothetical protein
MIADQDTTNQVLGAKDHYTGKTLRVPVVTLDHALLGRTPTLIKIDVEGFETEVLAGAEATLANPGLRAVIMEINGCGTRYGFDEDSLHQQMQAFGFQPCRYEPTARRVVDLNGKRSTSGNTLYLRKPDAIETALRQSPAYQVIGTVM